MKKQIAMLSAVAVFGFAAQANAGWSFGSMFSSATAAINKGIEQGKKLVGNVANIAADKAKEMAAKGVGALGSVLTQTVQKFGGIATNYVGTGAGAVSNWIQNAATKLTAAAPKFLAPFIAKGAAFGQGMTAKFASGLTGLIQQTVGKGEALIKAGMPKATEFANNLINSFKGKIVEGAAYASKVAQGKVTQMGGNVTKMFAGLGTSFAGKLKTLAQTKILPKVLPGKRR